MKNVFFVLLFFLLNNICFSQKFNTIWPEGEMPNSKGMQLEHLEERERITQVREPGFYSFLPAPEANEGAAVLILPSGGYHHLTYNVGGFQVAKWFNTLGISAFVLNYRLPTSLDLKIRYEGPIQDAQRAMKIIRANAEKYNIDPAKIGIFASSAGGHLASTLGTHSEDFSKIEGDILNEYSFKPDFLVLVSPVISFGKYTHDGSLKNFLGHSPSPEKIKEYSNELHVNKETPATFLVHSQNDNAVNPLNSIMFYKAMLEKGVEGSLHIFPRGEHAIGITNSSDFTDMWKELCSRWLKETGVLD